MSAKNNQLYAGNSSKNTDTNLTICRSSKNAVFMGTIRREVRKEKEMTPQRPNVGIQGQSSRLTPEWIAGFVDGEGCFHVGISKHKDLRAGYQILSEFTVVQHERDIDLLHELRSMMNCGVVRRNHEDRYCWRVRKLKNLSEVIIPFFEKYPLKSKKAVDFLKFKKVVMLMQRGDHLTEEGFSRIAKIASEMNRANARRKTWIKRESTPE